MSISTTRRALLAVLFGPVGRLLPFAWCGPIARVGAAVAWRAGFRRDVAMRNLTLAFPEMSDASRAAIARDSMRSLLTVFLELLTLRHLSRRGIRRWLVVENIELLRSIGPEGALLLSAHVGNWELLALGAAEIAGVPFAVVVKEQNDGRQLERMRTSRGNRLIPTGRGARETSVLVRSGGVVAMLGDQSAPEGEHDTEMFGIPT
jgi:KDO2-lipid IV(A) lauroyltransferase